MTTTTTTSFWCFSMASAWLQHGFSMASAWLHAAHQDQYCDGWASRKGDRRDCGWSPRCQRVARHLVAFGVRLVTPSCHSWEIALCNTFDTIGWNWHLARQTSVSRGYIGELPHEAAKRNHASSSRDVRCTLGCACQQNVNLDQSKIDTLLLWLWHLLGTKSKKLWPDYQSFRSSCRSRWMSLSSGSQEMVRSGRID